ncbi:50S ribosomal protein L21 [bacterium]|nr:50S ribosomal protein L21 [bacterium]
MQNYAIIEVGGRQFRVTEGDKVIVPRMETEAGDEVTIEKLLLLNRDGKVTVGAPYIEGAKALAKVVDHFKGEKVRGVKKKRRKGYKRTFGARPSLTTLEIAAINA